MNSLAYVRETWSIRVPALRLTLLPSNGHPNDEDVRIRTQKWTCPRTTGTSSDQFLKFIKVSPVTCYVGS